MIGKSIISKGFGQQKNDLAKNSFFGGEGKPAQIRSFFVSHSNAVRYQLMLNYQPGLDAISKKMALISCGFVLNYSAFVCIRDFFSIFQYNE